MASKLDMSKTITYCMIGFNSLHEIKHYIDNVLQYVDRFIYIDGGSTDGTIEYLQNLIEYNKLEIYNYKWKDDFPKQRNNYLNHFSKYQTEGWILVSDTDEHFTDDTLQNLRNILNKAISENYNGVKFLAYDIIIDDNNPNVIISNHVSKSNFHKPLFFKYDPSIKYSGTAHETLEGQFRWKSVDYMYEHIRTNKKIMERAIQNFWIYCHIAKLENLKMIEFRNLCLEYDIHHFKDYFNLYVNNNLPDKIENWLFKHRNFAENSNSLELLELRDMSRYYFKLKENRKTISTYISTKNAIFNQSILEQTIHQALLFSDEIIIVNSEYSSDGTQNLLDDLKNKYPDKIKLYTYKEDLNILHGKLANKKSFALEHCSMDYCILQDDDECIHEKYAEYIKQLPLLYPDSIGFRFNVIHFYRSYDHYQNGKGWYSKKIYMIKNNHNIKHGKVGTDQDNHIILDKDNITPLDSIKNIINTDVTVYHYGWSRNDAILLMKKYDQEIRWWGKDYWKNKEFPFKFDNPKLLQKFNDTHPKHMIPIIEKENKYNSMHINEYTKKESKKIEKESKKIENENINTENENIKISACILTRNESCRINDTINHVYPYVDEIIINDASDDTSTILEIKKVDDNYSKIKYFKSKCTNNFSEERNKMHRIASGDYLLHIDTDERFNIKFLRNMKNIIQEMLNKKTISFMFRFPRRNTELDINKDPDYQIRFVNRTYTKWIRNVHEIPIVINENIYKEHNKNILKLSLTTLDNYVIEHLPKNRKNIRKRWDILSNNLDIKTNKKLLICTMFKNSSMWLNDFLLCLDNLIKYNNKLNDKSINSKRLSIHLAFLGSKNNIDNTNYLLETYIKNSDIKIWYEKLDSDNMKRYEKLAYLRNYIIENATKNFNINDEDLVLFIDSDIKFNEDIVKELIIEMSKTKGDIIAPLICIENYGIFNNNYFYDTLAFINIDNERFSHYRPYIYGNTKNTNKINEIKLRNILKEIININNLRKINWEFNKNSPLQSQIPDNLYNKINNIDELNNSIEVNSVGSFYLMKYIVCKNIKYSGENESEQVEFMNKVTSNGFKIFVSQRLKVLHFNLEKYGIKWH